MSSRYYLPMRHDVVAKTMYNAIRRKDSPENKSIKTYSDVESIATHNMTEYWWNVPVKTSIKCKHNRPDIMIWDRKEKLCTVVEISCPADVNITLKRANGSGGRASMRSLDLLEISTQNLPKIFLKSHTTVLKLIHQTTRIVQPSYLPCASSSYLECFVSLFRSPRFYHSIQIYFVPRIVLRWYIYISFPV